MKRITIAIFLVITVAIFSQIFFGNIHAHTSYSDGRGTPEQAFKYARDSGVVDIQAITDHCHDLVYPLPDGSMKLNVIRQMAQKYTVEGEFIAISGYEWTLTSRGHITIYNTVDFLDRGRSDLFDIYAWIVEQKATAQFCHPGKTYGDFFDFVYFPEVDLYINTIEVGNGAGKSNNVIKPEYVERYQRALNRGWHVGASANQDNHDENWATANDARTAFVIDELTTEKVYQALATRSIYATEDRDAFISFSCEEAKMGEIAYDVPNARLRIEYSDPGEPVASAYLYSNHGVRRLDVSGDSWTTEVEVDNSLSYNWYFVKIDQIDGNEIVSSPIWFQSSSGHYLLNARTIRPRVVFKREFEIAFDLINSSRDDGIFSVTLSSQSGIALQKEYSVPAMTCVDFTESVYCEDSSLAFYVNDELAFNISVDFVNFVANLDTTHENYYVSELRSLTDFLKELGGEINPLIGEMTESAVRNGDVLILPLPDNDTFMKDFMAISEKQISFVADYVQNGGLLIIVLARKPITHRAIGSYEALFERLSRELFLIDGGTAFEGNREASTEESGGIIILDWDVATGKESMKPVDIDYIRTFLKVR